MHSSPPRHGPLQMLHGLGTRPDKSTERNPSSTTRYKDWHKEPCKYLEAGMVSRENAATCLHQETVKEQAEGEMGHSRHSGTGSGGHTAPRYMVQAARFHLASHSQAGSIPLPTAPHAHTKHIPHRLPHST